VRIHRANSEARVSRITVTLIWPGYVISLSILRATSRASRVAASSFTAPGSTMTRISRPAWTANAFSTPLKDMLIFSRSSSRRT
jgi:hypothetical protein